jgi:thioredoxin-like negative regulator of GroEL
MKPQNSLLLLAASASVSAKYIKNTNIRDISSLDEFESFVLSTNHPTVVQFVENNCQYTKVIMPLFIGEIQKIAGLTKAAQVNCDTNNDTQEICKSYNVKFSPQVKLFQGAEGAIKDFRLQYKPQELTTALTEFFDNAPAPRVELITDISKFAPKTENPSSNRIILLPATEKQNGIPNLFKSVSIDFQAPNNKFYYCLPELVDDLLEVLNVDPRSLLSKTGLHKYNSVLVTEGNRGPFLFKGSRLKRGSLTKFLSKYLTQIDPLNFENKFTQGMQQQEQKVLAQEQQLVKNAYNQQDQDNTPKHKANDLYQIQTKEEFRKFCLSEDSKPCIVSSIAARYYLDNMRILFEVRDNLKQELKNALNFVYFHDVQAEPEEIADYLDFLPYPASPIPSRAPGEPKKWYHSMAVAYINGPEKWKVNLKDEYASTNSILNLISQTYNNRNVNKRTKITKQLY